MRVFGRASPAQTPSQIPQLRNCYIVFERTKLPGVASLWTG
jgi:hypothetical protein